MKYAQEAEDCAWCVFYILLCKCVGGEAEGQYDTDMVERESAHTMLCVP